MRIILEAVTDTEKIVLEHLEKVASDELVEKINKGNKTLAQCWKYICKEAQKYLSNKNGAIADEVVFGWAIHFFEEDGIPAVQTPTSVKTQVTTSKNKTQEYDPDDEEIEDEDEEESTPKHEVKKRVNKTKQETLNKAFEQTSIFDLM